MTRPSVRQAERTGGLSVSMGGMVQVRRSAVPGPGTGRARMAIRVAHAARIPIAAARAVTAGTRGRRGTMVVAVSSLDRPSREPMTVAARTLSHDWPPVLASLQIRAGTARNDDWRQAAPAVLLPVPARAVRRRSAPWYSEDRLVGFCRVSADLIGVKADEEQIGLGEV